MNLNPAKCVFAVASGKFLGIMVSQRGIEFIVDFIAKHMVSQVLANFIVEFTYPYKEEEPPMETWKIQVDRSATKKVGGARVVLISPEKETLKYAVRL